MADAILSQSKACKKCGLDKPLSQYSKKSSNKDGLDTKCKACDSEKHKKYKAENNERILARGREYSKANREKENARHREWRAKNPGKSTEYCNRWKEKYPERYKEAARKANEKGAEREKVWNEANRDKLRAYTKKWQQANPEKRAAYIEANKEKFSKYKMEWKRANPELVRAQVHIRRARKVGNGGEHTGEELAQLIESQGHRCANPYCRIDLRTAKKELDHKEPLALGGSSAIGNLQWLCAPCNRRKHAKPMDEWLAAEERRSRKAA